ncbi:IPT/TIG domain-containing protein [Spongiactinospora sp. TRM90649]|uniref:IPT/TIG domain-containing protein n=1 Tax=Spongiactinospora sp. TRM90649 TaxID=3031114 RepID=UPI0023F7B366|nr:IPT/TIG domain-containing protein [Spongiactinospora sp. TRM90649]MDF5758971.1 IPT/TIG domain-containing protein [Spongiactinospora sp. TRM90649]
MSDASHSWRSEPYIRWDLVTAGAAAPKVYDVAPREGWPGTLIEITGSEFAPDRDDNLVAIGGERALVVEASATRLLVVAGEHTETGPIIVETGGFTADGGEFQVLPWPDPNDPSARGAPRFFHGPQRGSPQTNKKNQRVKVLLTFPTDHDPDTPAQRATLRNTLINRFGLAADYWDRASYGSTTWDFDPTDWIALTKTRRDYFWEQGDIDDARAAYLSTSRRLLRNGTSILHTSNSPTWFRIDHLSLATCPAPDLGRLIAGGQHGVHRVGVHAPGQCAHLPAGDRGHGVSQVPIHGPADEQETQQRPHRTRRDLHRRGRIPPRLRGDERDDRGGIQPLPPQLVPGHQGPQDPASHVHALTGSPLRQPAFLQQVEEIRPQRQLDRAEVLHRSGLRDHPGLPQVRQLLPQRPDCQPPAGAASPTHRDEPLQLPLVQLRRAQTLRLHPATQMRHHIRVVLRDPRRVSPPDHLGPEHRHVRRQRTRHPSRIPINRHVCLLRRTHEEDEPCPRL